MFRLLMLLGTILATGWFVPAHAEGKDWDIFAKKICDLSMYREANRPDCVKKISARAGADRNYLKTVQDACLSMDINPDTYGYGVFMNRTLDCYTEGLRMLDVGGSYSTSLVACNDGGDYGWIIRCYDTLIFDQIKQQKGDDATTRLVPAVRDAIQAEVEPITIITSSDKGATSPMTFAAVEAKVQSVLNSYSKAHDPQMGATRSWSCEVSENASVEACTVHLDLPYNWCYSGHFILKFSKDPKTGEANVTHYDWDPAN